MQKTNLGSKLQSMTGVSLIGLMLIIDSAFFIFARLLQPLLPPRQSAFYMMTLGALIVIFYAALKKKLHFRVFFKNLGFFLLIGFLVALSTNLNYEAIAFIDPGTASMLNQFTIIFGMFWGLVWLHEKLTKNQIIGAAIAIVGVVTITFQKGDYLRLGSLLVLISAMSYSFHSAVVKKYGADFNFLEFFAFRLLTTSFFIFIWNIFTIKMTWPSMKAWPILITVAVAEVAISRALYYMILRKYPISILSIILTISPVLTIVWSFLIFEILPKPIHLLGGLGIIIGVVIMSGLRGKNKKPVEEKQVVAEEAVHF